MAPIPNFKVAWTWRGTFSRSTPKRFGRWDYRGFPNCWAGSRPSSDLTCPFLTDALPKHLSSPVELLSPRGPRRRLTRNRGAISVWWSGRKLASQICLTILHCGIPHPSARMLERKRAQRPGCPRRGRGGTKGRACVAGLWLATVVSLVCPSESDSSSSARGFDPITFLLSSGLRFCLMIWSSYVG